MPWQAVKAPFFNLWWSFKERSINLGVTEASGEQGALIESEISFSPSVLRGQFSALNLSLCEPENEIDNEEWHFYGHPENFTVSLL